MGSTCAVNNNINLNLCKIKNAIVLTIAFLIMNYIAL